MLTVVSLGFLVAKVKTILFTFGFWYKYIARDLYTGPTPLGRGSGPRGRRQPTGDTRRAAAPPTALLLVWVLVGWGQRRGGANRPGGRSMRAHAEIELNSNGHVTGNVSMHVSRQAVLQSLLHFGLWFTKMQPTETPSPAASPFESMISA